MGEFNNNGVVIKLGPLQDNGGPTLTHALLPGSPAIDTGSAQLAPNIDQRGLARPRDGNNDGVVGFDIGAFEYGLMSAAGQQALALVTATPGLDHFTFQVTGPCFSGPGPQYSLLAQAEPGDIASVDGHTADGAWYRLFVKPGILCWASGDLGTFDGNPFGLPTLLAPPTPVPSSTATATRTPLPTRPWVASPTKTQAPAVICSSFKNKNDCETHGCTWKLVAGPPICK
jgi:hypothetical protein